MQSRTWNSVFCYGKYNDSSHNVSSKVALAMWQIFPGSERKLVTVNKKMQPNVVSIVHYLIELYWNSPLRITWHTMKTVKYRHRNYGELKFAASAGWHTWQRWRRVAVAILEVVSAIFYRPLLVMPLLLRNFTARFCREIVPILPQLQQKMLHGMKIQCVEIFLRSSDCNRRN